jgi:hypothetical protein
MWMRARAQTEKEFQRKGGKENAEKGADAAGDGRSVGARSVYMRGGFHGHVSPGQHYSMTCDMGVGNRNNVPTWGIIRHRCLRIIGAVEEDGNKHRGPSHHEHSLHVFLDPNAAHRHITISTTHPETFLTR